MRMKIASILVKFRLSWLLLCLYRLFGCRFRINTAHRNHFHIRNSVLCKSRIIVTGYDNFIRIDDNTFIEGSHIKIVGNRNRVSVGKNAFANQLNIIIEGDDNEIVIGNNFFVFGNTRLYVVDNSKLSFGSDCMLSDNIEIRTTDNHGIYDMTTGNRINAEENIQIGNHVWIGMGSTILKGASIPDGCINGAKSIVTKTFTEENICIVGHNKVIKHNVTWAMERRSTLK